MTTKVKRIKIAEACGWKYEGEKSTSPKGEVFYGDYVIPDYFDDLNAMHEAEKGLNQEQADKYDDILALSKQDGTWAGCHIWHQKPSERAEAFGLAMNLWNQNE